MMRTNFYTPRLDLANVRRNGLIAMVLSLIIHPVVIFAILIRSDMFASLWICPHLQLLMSFAKSNQAGVPEAPIGNQGTSTGKTLTKTNDPTRESITKI